MLLIYTRYLGHKPDKSRTTVDGGGTAEPHPSPLSVDENDVIADFNEVSATHISRTNANH